MKNKTHLIAIAAALVAAPLAFAHTDGGVYGTPKTYCEDMKGDQETHDYGPSTGFVIFLGQDGSLGPECPYAAGTENPTFDGHYEHAFGGAWLVAGDGTACGWPYADHPEFPVVSVFDEVLSQIPADVSFSVYADTVNNVPPVDPNEPNCGDVESDFGVDCTNSCAVGFPPGLDGTYQVYVSGTAGHITTGNGILPCLPDDLEVVGAEISPNTYQGKVTLHFTVGFNRVLTGESVVQTGGPPPNPNPVVETRHSGTGGGSLHTWTIGGSADFATREFTYTFTTACQGIGFSQTTSGVVYVYN